MRMIRSNFLALVPIILTGSCQGKLSSGGFGGGGEASRILWEGDSKSGSLQAKISISPEVSTAAEENLFDSQQSGNNGATGGFGLTETTSSSSPYAVTVIDPSTAKPFRLSVQCVSSFQLIRDYMVPFLPNYRNYLSQFAIYLQTDSGHELLSTTASSPEKVMGWLEPAVSGDNVCTQASMEATVVRSGENQPATWQELQGFASRLSIGFFTHLPVPKHNLAHELHTESFNLEEIPAAFSNVFRQKPELGQIPLAPLSSLFADSTDEATVLVLLGHIMVSGPLADSSELPAANPSQGTVQSEGMFAQKYYLALHDGCLTVAQNNGETNAADSDDQCQRSSRDSFLSDFSKDCGASSLQVDQCTFNVPLTLEGDQLQASTLRPAGESGSQTYFGFVSATCNQGNFEVSDESWCLSVLPLKREICRGVNCPVKPDMSVFDVRESIDSLTNGSSSEHPIYWESQTLGYVITLDDGEAEASNYLDPVLFCDGYSPEDNRGRDRIEIGQYCEDARASAERHVDSRLHIFAHSPTGRDERVEKLIRAGVLVELQRCKVSYEDPEIRDDYFVSVHPDDECQSGRELRTGPYDGYASVSLPATNLGLGWIIRHEDDGLSWFGDTDSDWKTTVLESESVTLKTCSSLDNIFGSNEGRCSVSLPETYSGMSFIRAFSSPGYLEGVGEKSPLADSAKGYAHFECKDGQWIEKEKSCSEFSELRHGWVKYDTDETVNGSYSSSETQVVHVDRGVVYYEPEGQDPVPSYSITNPNQDANEICRASGYDAATATCRSLAQRIEGIVISNQLATIDGTQRWALGCQFGIGDNANVRIPEEIGCVKFPAPLSSASQDPWIEYSPTTPTTPTTPNSVNSPQRACEDALFEGAVSACKGLTLDQSPTFGALSSYEDGRARCHYGNFNVSEPSHILCVPKPLSATDSSDSHHLNWVELDADTELRGPIYWTQQDLDAHVENGLSGEDKIVWIAGNQPVSSYCQSLGLGYQGHTGLCRGAAEPGSDSGKIGSLIQNAVWKDQNGTFRWGTTCLGKSVDSEQEYFRPLEVQCFSAEK